MTNNVLQAFKLIILFSGFLFTGLNGQTYQGKWFAEGNIGDLEYRNYTSQNPTGFTPERVETNRYYFGLYPRLGYFLSDDFVIGATLTFDLDGNRTNYYSSNARYLEEERQTMVLGLEPFLRYYFTNATSNTRVYIQAGAGGGVSVSGREEYTEYFPSGRVLEYFNFPFKSKFMSAEGIFGVNHFFNEKVALNFALGYSYNKTTYQYTAAVLNNNNNSPAFDVLFTETAKGITWNLGFTIMISDKKARLKDLKTTDK